MGGGDSKIAPMNGSEGGKTDWQRVDWESLGRLRRYGNVEEPAPADALDVDPFVLVWRAELAILRGGAAQSDMGMGDLWMWSDMA